MNTNTRSKIVKIGNSRGIRIPRTLLEQAGLSDEVEMMVQENKLIIWPAQKPRQNWDEQFALMAQHGEDQLIDDFPPVQWDEEDWEW